MEIWSYIEILRNKKQSLFFQKDNVEIRLNALTNILEFGTPRDIQYLIPFLTDKNNEIQNATCNTITCLFSRSLLTI
jgi:hypothetical protein